MAFTGLNGFIGPISSVNSLTATFTSVANVYGTTPVAAGDSVRYYVFRNPLNTNFQASNINLAQTQQGTNHQDFGIKFAKPGKNTSSTDLRDYTIHSGTKSLQVHQVIYAPLGTIPSSDTFYSGITGLKYLTDLPYDPVFFAFYSPDNQNFYPLSAANQVPPKINFNSIDGGIIINDQGGTGGWGVFFVLLDPYQSTTQVNAVL